MNFIAIPQADYSDWEREPFSKMVAEVETGQDRFHDAQLLDRLLWEKSDKDENEVYKGAVGWGSPRSFERMKGYAIFRKGAARDFDRDDVAALWYQGF